MEALHKLNRLFFYFTLVAYATVISGMLAHALALKL